MREIAKAAAPTALAAVIGSVVAGPAAAQEAAGVPAETRFISNTLSFLMSGFLVMWMTAGFTMLEAGLARKRSVGAQLLRASRSIRSRASCIT